MRFYVLMCSVWCKMLLPLKDKNADAISNSREEETA